MITFEEKQDLIQTLLSLQYEYTPNNDLRLNLKDDLTLRHYRDVLTKLHVILNSFSYSQNRQLVGSLKDYLGSVWSLINGTYLTYTTCVDSDFTNLLCQIALLVCREVNSLIEDKSQPPLGTVEVLMPTVNRDSVHDKFSDLKPIYNEEDEAWEDINIFWVLRNHILSRNGLYLIPIQILTEEKQFNPYYDYTNHSPECAYVNEEEYRRLIRHSSLTQAWQDAKDDYQIYLMNNNNLLGHLNQLVKKMFLYSTLGIGQELHAGELGYVALKNFADYYNELPKETIQQIPTDVRKEIKKLLKFGSNFQFNQNHSIETCLATRRECLKAAMHGKEETLASIAIQDTTKSILQTKAKEQFEHAQWDLIEKLDTNVYQGTDSLPLRKSLMDYYQPQIIIQGPEYIYFIKELMPEEIQEVLSDLFFLEKYLYFLKTPDAFVNLITELSSEKLKAFLEISAPLMERKVIHKLEYLGSVLELLDRERFLIILNAFKDKLHILANDSKEFQRFFENLYPFQRDIIYDFFKEKFNSFLLEKEDFINIYMLLSQERKYEFYEEHKHRLLGLIKSSSAFLLVMKELDSTHYKSFCKIFTVQFSEFFHNIEDCISLLQLTPIDQFEFVSLFLRKSIPFTLLNNNNFLSIIKNLEQEKHQLFFNHHKHTLPFWITSVDELNEIINHLSPEESDELFRLCKAHLPKIVRTGFDFKFVAQHLGKSEIRWLFNELYPSLRGKLRSSKEFCAWMYPLSIKQCHRFFQDYENKILSLFSSKNEYLFLCNALYDKPDLIIESLSYFHSLLRKWVYSIDEFNHIMEHLPEKAQSSLFQHLKSNLYNSIRSARAFQSTLTYLKAEERVNVYTNLQSRLHLFIRDFESLINVIHYLPSTEIQAVLNFSKNKLLKFAPNAVQVNKRIQSLRPDLALEIAKAYAPLCRRLLSSSSDFLYLIEGLSEELQHVFYAHTKKKLGMLPFTPFNFCMFVTLSKREICMDFCESYQSTLLLWLNPLSKSMYYLRGLSKDKLSMMQIQLEKALFNEMEQNLNSIFQIAERLTSINEIHHFYDELSRESQSFSICKNYEVFKLNALNVIDKFRKTTRGNVNSCIPFLFKSPIDAHFDKLIQTIENLEVITLLSDTIRSSNCSLFSPNNRFIVRRNEANFTNTTFQA